MDEVLPPELFYYERYNGSASLCLAKCREEGFDVAMLRNVNVEDFTERPHTYDCYCLSELYRFRSVDLDFECLNYWCPSITGPCVPAGQSPQSPRYMAAVYCRGEACSTDILANNEVSGVCESEGEFAKISDERVILYLHSY